MQNALRFLIGERLSIICEPVLHWNPAETAILSLISENSFCCAKDFCHGTDFFGSAIT